MISAGEKEPVGLQQFAGQNTAAAAIFDSGTIYRDSADK